MRENVVYIDHKHLGQTKYQRGYRKTTENMKMLGLTDDSGVVILQQGDTERQIETNHYVGAYTDDAATIYSDKGGAFNSITEIGDGERIHKTVNHSG